MAKCDLYNLTSGGSARVCYVYADKCVLIPPDTPWTPSAHPTQPTQHTYRPKTYPNPYPTSTHRAGLLERSRLPCWAETQPQDVVVANLGPLYEGPEGLGAAVGAFAGFWARRRAGRFPGSHSTA